METPWGWIQAKKEASEYAEKLKDLQRKVDEALKLLKEDNPDIKLVIRILERKGGVKPLLKTRQKQFSSSQRTSSKSNTGPSLHTCFSPLFVLTVQP